MHIKGIHKAIRKDLEYGAVITSVLVGSKKPLLGYKQGLQLSGYN